MRTQVSAAFLSFPVHLTAQVNITLRENHFLVFVYVTDDLLKPHTIHL